MTLDDVPPRFAEPLARHLSGDLAQGLAYVALVMAAADDAELAGLLERLAPRDPRLAALRDLAAGHPGAAAAIRAVLAAVDHSPDPTAPPEAVMARLAAGFDAAASVDPATSVALHSLGDEDRLAATTDEIVRWLNGRGLLPRDGRVVEIGCGIGRFGQTLAGRVGGYLGLDISGGMIETALRRCAGLPATDFRVGSGHDLAGIADGSVGLVMAVDSFPYLVQAGGTIAATAVAEAARVLAPGRPLVVLNWSYRDDPARDVADAQAFGQVAGLIVEIAGERPFATWDGTAVVLRKPD